MLYIVNENKHEYWYTLDLCCKNDPDIELLTKAVTDESKDDFTVMPSLLIKMIPATFFESWMRLNVSSNSGVKVIFATGPEALNLLLEIF